jgi:uncharacterized phage-associated protein
MASVHDVAAYILNKQGGSISTWKLQKLAYYSQAWHLVWAEDALFQDRIEAWANGPVIPALFSQHRGQFNVSTWSKGDPDNLSDKEKATVDRVLASYGGLSGQQLSILTHAEDPWREARVGLAPTERSTNQITREALVFYYGALETSEDAVDVDKLEWGPATS